MNLILKRKHFLSHTTIGELYVNEAFCCYILEDIDRNLDQGMDLETIKKEKIYSQTAIPTGKYIVDITHSQRYCKPMPIVLNVPGYEGIRIHPGNTDKDTSGCLIPGSKFDLTAQKVTESTIAFIKLFELLKATKDKKEVISLEIVREV